MRRQISAETKFRAAAAFRSVNQFAHVLDMSRSSVSNAMRLRNVEEVTAIRIEEEFARLNPLRHIDTLERLINESHTAVDFRAIITLDEAYDIQALIVALTRKVE